MSPPTPCRLGLALKSRDAVAARLFWSRPCEASDLPIPSPSSCAAAAEDSAVFASRGREASARSVRDVVAAVDVVLAAEQLAVLCGAPPPAHCVIFLFELVLQLRPPHSALVPVLRQLQLLRRRGRGQHEVHHPRPPQLICSAGACARASPVPERGRARHRGHLPIRRQHLRHHPLPTAQVGISEGMRGSACEGL